MHRKAKIFAENRKTAISGTLYAIGYGFSALVPEGNTPVAVELIEIPRSDWRESSESSIWPRNTDDGVSEGGVIFFVSGHNPESVRPELELALHQGKCIGGGACAVGNSVSVTLEPGKFALFFPEEGHIPGLISPGAGRGVVKIVVKIAVTEF